MEYLAGQRLAAASLASLDGKTFAPLPLKRKERLADGREVMREVPVSEYRSLRWTIASLDARGERIGAARVARDGRSVAAAIQR